MFARLRCVGHSALVCADRVVLRDGLPVQSPVPSLMAWKRRDVFNEPCKENLQMGKSFNNLNSRDHGLSGYVKRRK